MRAELQCRGSVELRFEAVLEAQQLHSGTHLAGADTHLAGADTHLAGADTHLAGADTHLAGADTHLAVGWCHHWC
jgi:hypothetical protein